VAFFRNGQNLNFAIPVNYLSALLGKVGPTKPLSQVKSAKAAESIMADLGDPNREGVVGKQLLWANSDYGSAGGAFDFSIHNQLREGVRKVYCLVVFYDRSNNPIDFTAVEYPGTIPAGLAKRVRSVVATSVKNLTRNYGRTEIRILDFRLQGKYAQPESVKSSW
jgi:hypothetical protein